VKNNIYIYMCVFLLDCIVHILEIINLICLCYFILFFVCCVYFNELIYIYIDLLFFCFFGDVGGVSEEINYDSKGYVLFRSLL